MLSVSYSIFLSMNCAVLAISRNCLFLMAIDCNDYKLSQIDQSNNRYNCTTLICIYVRT